MPPATGKDRRQQHWQSIASALRAHGLPIPDYATEGLVYLLGTDLRPHGAQPYMAGRVRNLTGAFAALVATLPPGEPIHRAMADIQGIECGTA
jgi:hypothetical protein